MSDQKFDNAENVDQDLQNLAYGGTRNQKAPFSEEEQTSQGLNPEQSDRSLSAIHTGSRHEHEDAPMGRDDGAKSDELQSDIGGAPETSNLRFDLTDGDGTEGASLNDGGAQPQDDALNQTELREVELPRGGERLLQDTVLPEENSEIEAAPAQQAAIPTQDIQPIEPEDEDEPFRPNLAPEDIQLDDNLVIENAEIGDLVGRISAHDPEGERLTYILVDDAGGRFTIDKDTGEIRVAGGLDFENMPSHEIIVQVSDGTNVTEQSFTINVGDFNEAPELVSLDNNAIIENAAAGSLVGSVSAVDQENDALTYSLADDAGGRFTIDPATGEIRVAGDLDYESATSHEIVVNVSDGTNVTQQSFTIQVGDENEAPNTVQLDDNSIIENAAVGELVGTVSAADPENNNLTYSLADDAGGRFTIDPATGEIRVASDLDYESATSHEIVVNVSDGTNVTQQSFTIQVGDENEAPNTVQLDDNSIIENATVGELVGTVSAADPENNNLTYSLADDAGGRFTIDPATGEIRVAGDLDYESATSHEIVVNVSDGTNVTQQNFTIQVGDVNEGPEAGNVDLGSTNEDTAFTFTNADLLANSSDVDGDSLTVTSVSVDPAYGVLTEIAPGEYRFEPVGDLSIDDVPLQFTVSDGEFTSDATATLDIAAVSDAPELSVTIGEPTMDVAGGNLQHATINANSAYSSDSGFQVLGRIIQEDGTLSEASAEYVEAGWSGLGEHGGSTPGYISVGGANDGNSHLIGADESAGLSEQLIIQLDGEATSADVGILHLMGSNGSGSKEEGFYTLLRDGQVVGSGNFIGESGGHEARYTLTADDNGPFDTIIFEASEDFYGRTNGHSDYAITSIELDQVMPEVPVNVYDVDVSAALTDIDGSETLSAITFDNLPDGTILSAGAQNEDGSWTLPLSDLENLTMQVPTASVGSTFDLTVSVSSTDGDAAPATTTVSLTATAIDTAPENAVLDNATIAETADVGDVVGVVSATDLDGDVLSYSLADDAGGLFSINSETGEITVAGELDFETAATHDVVVEVTDGENTISQSFTINVGDVAPGEMSGRGTTVDTQNVGEAMDLDHMDVFPDLYSPGNLEDRVGTEVFEDMVADANQVYVNYQSDAQVTFQGEIAGYRNSVGGYQVDGDGNIVSVQLLWGDASDDKLATGESTALYEGIDKGNQLGFFVIQDGFGGLPDCSYLGDGNSFPDEGQWVFVSSDFNPTIHNPEDYRYNINEDIGAPKLIYVEEDGTVHTIGKNVYHSTHQDALNPETDVDNREHFVAGVDAENGILNFGFEDMYNGGDEDFNDGMFSVEIDVRDLVQVPNALFTKDDEGQSSFQIADGENAGMQSLTLTMTNCLEGDQLNFSGGYTIVDGELQLTDGTDLGLGATIVDDGATITITITGEASADLYESIIQSINFFNPDQGVDISGVRDISVEGVSGHGEEMDLLSTTITVGEDQEISGTSADETLTGGLGDDTLTGGGGYDRYYAGAGNDEVIGGSGTDFASGEAGHDSMSGGAGNDILDGGEGHDTLDGGVGDDMLGGGAGDDSLFGGAGDDSLLGGAGDDYMSGGDGSDIFFFGMSDGFDTVAGGDGAGWSDSIVLYDGVPDGDIGDWLTLTSGQVESIQDGEIFLSEDASGTINLGNDAVLTFEGIEKIEI